MHTHYTYYILHTLDTLDTLYTTLYILYTLDPLDPLDTLDTQYTLYLCTYGRAAELLNRLSDGEAHSNAYASMKDAEGIRQVNILYDP